MDTERTGHVFVRTLNLSGQYIPHPQNTGPLGLFCSSHSLVATSRNSAASHPRHEHRYITDPAIHVATGIWIFLTRRQSTRASRNHRTSLIPPFLLRFIQSLTRNTTPNIPFLMQWVPQSSLPAALSYLPTVSYSQWLYPHLGPHSALLSSYTEFFHL